ncbi:hypothetical protein CR513_42569, partial [Mucuna pruriens]
LQAYANQVTQPQSTQSQPQPQSTQPQPQPRPRPTPSQHPPPPPPPPQTTQSQPPPLPQTTQCQPPPPPRTTQSQPPPPPRTTQSQPIPIQVLHMHEYPIVNEVLYFSFSHVSENNNGHKILIFPEGDGFDQHKLVVGTISSIMRSNLEEAKPSWKKLSMDQRDSWFDIFKSKFTWQPQFNDMVRPNFEKRCVAKMTQLMQEARKNLNKRPIWMRDGKEAKGIDPSLSEFYFRTHRKKDQSWVGPHAKST